MFYKILIVIFLTLSTLIFTGEAYLRNFSSYGVEYFMKLEQGVKKDVESELNFIPYDALDALLKGKKDSAHESDQNGVRTCRIIVLGDSVACGGEMGSRELRFSNDIKEILQQNYPDVNFDVLVCAAGGWSTTQEVIAYEKYCQDMRHDLVILAYCQNDDAEAYQQIRKIGGQPVLAFYKTGVPYISLVPFNKFFTERLLIARFINEHLIKLLQRCHLSFHIDYCLIRDDKIYLAFRKLYTLTKSKNIPVIVAVFPHLVEEFDMHDARISSLIQKWCKELGWGYVNLQEPFKGYGLRALRANLKDGIHPNSLGHRIAAEAIAGELQQTVAIKDIVNSVKRFNK
ncbi:MAG: SGNH/GDSL hydrolase family protein [Candidatus Omnitrophota bacterium]